MRILKILASQPARLLITITIAFIFHNFIPLVFKQFFLGISLSLKEILMFMIPLIIFSSVYSAFSKIRGNAFYFIIILLLCIISSNFISVGIAGIFGHFVLLTNDNIAHKPQEILGLIPLWSFHIPKLVSNNVVLVISLTLACLHQPTIIRYTDKVSDFTKKIVKIFLIKFFSPLLPLFIFGFLLKLLNDDIISEVLAVNPSAFFLMILVLILYLCFILMLAVWLYKNSAIEILRNIAAPAITAFTSMSSAAALPFSIKAAEKNTKNNNLSDVVMPATVNIHMIGDSICIPIMAMILLLAFGHSMPSLDSYLLFAVSFVMTKFSGAGVPGGSILVMIPVLESTLGFTPEMVALITISYMLLDPICTSGNVIGNNLFVIHFNKLYGFIRKKLQ